MNVLAELKRRLLTVKIDTRLTTPDEVPAYTLITEINNITAIRDTQILEASLRLGINWDIASFMIYHNPSLKLSVFSGMYFWAGSGAVGAWKSVALTG